MVDSFSEDITFYNLQDEERLRKVVSIHTNTIRVESVNVPVNDLKEEVSLEYDHYVESSMLSLISLKHNRDIFFRLINILTAKRVQDMDWIKTLLIIYLSN